MTGVQLDDGVIVGQFAAPRAEAEHFSAALDKDSPLTACVNAAIGRLDGQRGRSTRSPRSGSPTRRTRPVFQP